jgi:hypothetical protein
MREVVLDRFECKLLILVHCPSKVDNTEQEDLHHLKLDTTAHLSWLSQQM